MTNGVTTARRARSSDAWALTTLRAIMLDAMAEGPPVADDAVWKQATADWFRVRLLETEHFAAFVVDDAALGTVASACATVSRGAPLPGHVGEPVGQLFSVATDPRARLRGHSRACVTAVLGWLDDAGVARTLLSATPDGAHLYRSLGFRDRAWVQMWR